MFETVSIYKLGIYGKAYDVPGTCRAYTYKYQPDNQGAWRLGEAMSIASKAGGGDYIDTGLGLLKQLEMKGYGVYELEEAGAPEEQQAPVAVVKENPFCPEGKSDEISEYLPVGTRLFATTQPVQVNRIPAGLYAELEALRALRDATDVYLQGYMRDEIEDEESCSADQHEAACSVKAALDKSRALEWKGSRYGKAEHAR